MLQIRDLQQANAWHKHLTAGDDNTAYSIHWNILSGWYNFNALLNINTCTVDREYCRKLLKWMWVKSVSWPFHEAASLVISDTLQHVMAWMSIYITRNTMDVITYPCYNLNYIMRVNKIPRCIALIPDARPAQLTEIPVYMIHVSYNCHR